MITNVFKKIINAAIKPNYEGNVDGLFDGQIHGWARKKDAAEPIEIDIFINGNKAHSRIKCDKMREDLRLANVGNGLHGFSFHADFGDYENALEIIVRISDTSAFLMKKTVQSPLVTPTESAKPQSNVRRSLIETPTVLAPKVPEYKVRIEWNNQNTLRGWMINVDKVDEIFDADIFINNVWYRRVRNDVSRGDLKKLGLSNGRGGIELPIPNGLLQDGKNIIGVRPPKGDIVTQEIQATFKSTYVPQPDPVLDTKVSIIVPIYNAFEDVEACIKLLIAHTTQAARLILIDDASPDPRIASLLKDYTGEKNISVLTNKVNLGFTKTVNRGIKEAGTDDVIFLNSDARVTPNWLEGLRRAAASDPMIGTVTPLSDRAGAFSAPKIGNENKLPFGVEEAEYAVAASRESLRLYPTVPTGNGFCMYVRRACIAVVGNLDEEAFPRGYGEENDFCMRARSKGWRNIIDDGTYIFHERSKSFGDQKTDLMAAGSKVVKKRHPDYQFAIKVFGSSPQISLARYKVQQSDCKLRASNVVLPRALFVTATASGGTPQTNRDLMDALSKDWDCWLLRCDSRKLSLSRLENGNVRPIKEHTLQETVSPTTHTSFEYDRIVAAWLSEIKFELVHIRQLIWHSLTLPRLAKSSGAMVINSFHDFYTLSPSVKLLDQNDVFCGAKLPEGGIYGEADLWPEETMPALNQHWINIWQQKFVDALEVCDAYVTTSPSARDMMMSVMPKKAVERFAIIPHGRDFDQMHQNFHWPSAEESVRILVPGNISTAKGLGVIEKLLELDETNQRLEFHILGKHNFEGERRGLKFHGSYERAHFAARVAKINPHVGAVLSIWDETYCHTLTEMWAAGLPVIGLKYPTVANRIRNSGAGWVYDEADIAAFYNELVANMGDVDGFMQRQKSVIDWQRGEGRANSTRAMASKYHALYGTVRKLVRENTAPFQALDHTKVRFQNFAKDRVAVVGPAYADQSVAPPSTHVRLWARTFNALERDVTYLHMSPDELLASVRTGEIDKAIIQRNAIPARIWNSLAGLIDDKHFRYVVDLDDDLLNVPADKDPDGKYADYAKTLTEIIAKASHVTVSTEALGKSIAKVNASYSVVPNYLSGRIWRGDLPERVDDGLVRAIYMGNRSHDADFEMIRPAFETLSQKYPQLRLRLIGAIQDRPASLPSWLEIVEIPQGAKNYPDFVRWLQTQTNTLDFGIAPLTSGAFNKHKSYLKILDYAGLGLPVIASKHPVYEPLKGPDHIKLVANSKSAWEKAIIEMIGTKSSGTTERDARRAWVTDNHLLEATLPDFDKLIRSKLFKDIE